MNVLMKDSIVDQVQEKEALFHSLLKHPAIRSVRSKGLLMAVELDTAESVSRVLKSCLDKGLFSDWFLFAPECIRIAPPLTISEEDIRKACSIILSCL